MIAQMRKERKTKPRLQSGAAVQQTTALVNGQLRRGKLAVCPDGRVYFGLIRPVLRPTEAVNDGERLLTAPGLSVVVDDRVLQTLKGMVAR